MRTKYLILSLLVLIPLYGCSNMEYDPFGKLNKEITLFHDGIALPIGNVGPVTVHDLLSNGSVRDLMDQFMKEDPDGQLYVEAEEEFFSQSAFEVALKSPDNTQPYHWEVGDQYGSVGSVASALSMFGFGFPHQMLMVQAGNPLYANILLNTTARITCVNKNYEETYAEEKRLADFSISSSYTPRTLTQFDLPENVLDHVSKVELKGVTLDLPANLPDLVRSGSNSFFRFSYKYKALVALTESFKMPMTFPVENLNVELGQFNLHECQLSFDLVNSLPIDVKVEDIRVLDESGSVDPGVEVSSGFTIYGGSLESPTTTPVTLSVKSLDGTLPDIHGIEATVSFSTHADSVNLPLSTKMCLSVKSASVIVSGGITIPSHVL